MQKLTVVIQTKDDAEHIAESVVKAKQITENVLVIDEGSQDTIMDLAKQAGAKVIADPKALSAWAELSSAAENIAEKKQASVVADNFVDVTDDVFRYIKDHFPGWKQVAKDKSQFILNNAKHCDIFSIVAFLALCVGIWFTQGTGNIGTILCILALVWQYHLHKANVLTKDNKRLLWIYCLWAGAVLFSTFYGEQPYHWISRWANLYVWCSLPIWLLLVLRRGEKWNKIGLAVGIVVLTILCGLLAYEGIKYHHRAGAIIETNVMAMASVLSITLPGIFVCFLDERVFGKYRGLVLPLFVVCNIGLLYNQTRGAWIACGLMYLVAFVVYFRRNITITTIVLVMGLIVGAFLGSNSYIGQRWTLDPSHSSNASRVRIWTSAYHIWKDNPVLGSGYMTFEKLYQTKYILPTVTPHEKHLTHAHNNWMMVLAQQGLMGEAFFWLCYGSLLWYGIKEHRKYKDPYSLMLALIVAGTLIQGSTECNLHMPYFTRIFWTVTGWSLYAHSLWKGKQLDGTSKN